jgi:hypothetical protein
MRPPRRLLPVPVPAKAPRSSRPRPTALRATSWATLNCIVTAETQKIYHDTDPLKMFRAKAAKLKLMTAEECDAIDAKCEQKIKDAKEYAMQSEYADASEYMKYVYVDD